MHGYAQTPNSGYVFKHITSTDGLIKNKVTAICQDSEGFIWIGTQVGLQRYDGTRFTNYPANIRDTAALQTDWVSYIFEDSKKRLWVCTDQQGPYFLNKKTGKFYNYNLHAAAGNKINGIWNIAEDRQGTIWIGAHDGFYRLNNATNQFEKQNDKLGLSKKIKTAYIYVDADDNLWLATTEGVKLYNQQQKKLYDEKYNPQQNPLFNINGYVGSILRQGDEVWFTIERKLYRYKFSTNEVKTFTFKTPVDQSDSHFLNELIGAVYKLSNGTIVALLLNRGLAFYQPATDNFVIALADNSKPYAFHLNYNADEGACLYQDRDDNVMIGNGTGINIFNPGKQFAQSHGHFIKDKENFPRAEVNAFLEADNGDIFAGYYSTDGGIVKMDSNFHFINRYFLPGKSSELSGDNQVWGLFKGYDNFIWAPNQSNSLLKLNLSTNQLSKETDSMQTGPIITIVRDESGNSWTGYWRDGLSKTDAIPRKKTYYKQFLYSSADNAKRVYSLLIDADSIWVGTLQNGLQVFNKKTEKFTSAFLPSEKNNGSISSNCVTDIIRYNKDTLILATLMGINIFDVRSKIFTAITAKEGLPNNLVQTLLKDELGNIWVAGYDAWLCKLNMHDLSITNYDITDGITDQQFTCKFYQLKNGKVLIGESGSFISFDPSSLVTASPPACVRITGLRIFEKQLFVDSLLNNQPLSLSYKDNSIRIEFASLQYWNQASIKYYYKLDGIDKDWVLADKDHAAVYNNLKDGKYQFKVKCANRDGIFCKDITTLQIIIHPPFWKTWWFLLLSIIAGLVIFYCIIKWREANIKAVEAEKLKLQQLNADHYKSKLELEQIINYFSSSLIDKNQVDDVLWDVAKNLIGRLGFVDCMIYLWNEDKTRMLQKAGFGPKDSAEEISKQLFTVLPGQGIVGQVMLSKRPVVIPDTSKDDHYRADDITRLSEITVPIIYDNELLGIIDSEHPEKNFYTEQHLQLLATIATLVGNKIKSIEAEQLLQQTNIEMYSISEQLSKAKLEALRSQMNPHFIFNSLNAIQECILTNKIDAAYKYLSKFSKLQRMVLNNSQKELIPLSGEIEMLQLYLSLESLRFSRSFTYSIDITGIADADEIMIPSMITQPLVENAIWHGLRNKIGDKVLLITYTEKEGSLMIIIEDNGIGREQANIIKAQKIGSGQFASKGTMLLQQRLYVLSQQLKTDIQLHTTDKKDSAGLAAGTIVTITFPSNLETAETAPAELL